MGTGRHLESVGNPEAERISFAGALPALLDALDGHVGAGRRVCVLASGDPGFFGIVRALSERFGAAGLAVHPAPSSVALAFARLGVPWDDAAVVSAHGRDLAEAVAMHRPSSARWPSSCRRTTRPRRWLGLCSPRAARPATSPCAATWPPPTRSWPAPTSTAWRPARGTRCRSWSSGDDPLVPDHASLSWGLSEDRFAHRAGMITKAEVHAIALGKLDLPAAGVLWDVGAGSGSVAVECARLRPGLHVIAIEQNHRDTERIARQRRRAPRDDRRGRGRGARRLRRAARPRPRLRRRRRSRRARRHAAPAASGGHGGGHVRRPRPRRGGVRAGSGTSSRSR